MERIPLYAFAGPEGSGKSTQAKLLASRLDLPYISTGDMIRDAAANDPTELGDACRKMFAEHNYLPGPLLLKIVAKRLGRRDVERGLVLDGGFRTLEETKNFASVIAETRKDFAIKVIFLRVPGWQSIGRMLDGNRGRTDDTLPASLSRLKSFYTDLGKRMSVIRENYEFVMIIANNRSVEEVGKEVIVKAL